MGYDIDDHNGYCIETRIFLKGFLARKDCEDYDSIVSFLELHEWMNGLLAHSDNFLECAGPSSDFPGGCPFSFGKYYMVFDRDKLIDKHWTNIGCVHEYSKGFIRLKKFMRKHKIPNKYLVYYEWKTGG